MEREGEGEPREASRGSVAWEAGLTAVSLS